MHGAEMSTTGGGHRMRAVAAVLMAVALAGCGGGSSTPRPRSASLAKHGTATPIKHLVVIYQENVSFDHYFGTYPRAANLPGEPVFHAAPGTPAVNGLSATLLRHNPNLANPHRLAPSQAYTCDENHDYRAEQAAYDHGAMDRFVQDTGARQTLAQCRGHGPATPGNEAVMDYFDGNTATALWSYAQHFAMSDNSFATTFGPSTPGAINVSAATTFGAICGPSWGVMRSHPCHALPGSLPSTPGRPEAAGAGTVYGDPDPNFDYCSGTNASETAQLGGRNIGDLLNHAGVTWGWFQGGFASPRYVAGRPQTDDLRNVCSGGNTNASGAWVLDYVAHHEPFQYYRSTANPKHLPPASIATIGRRDRTNHQYDLRDFWAAADGGNLPAVSYLKAPRYQDGHAGYSDPVAEQLFLVATVDRIEHLPTWSSTAIVIAYDDSDGWYDHVAGPRINGSRTTLDALDGKDQCRGPITISGTGVSEQGRCGTGPRLPLLVISPFAKRNFIDHTFTDQTSIVRFIEDNWLAGERIGNGSADAKAGALDGMFDFKAGPANPPLYLTRAG